MRRVVNTLGNGAENTIGLDELIAKARAAHETINAEPTVALERAFEAGDALIAAKAQVLHGEWTKVLATTGIPPSTARLYMQLARERERIVVAGCTSIREARRLLTGTKPRAGSRSSRQSVYGEPKATADRYEEGYADGYRAGRVDGRAAAARERLGANGPAALPLDRKDLLWIIKLAHPDVHDDKQNLRATRITQWLNELLGGAARG